MSRFDWPSLMRLGCRQVGLRPEEFWRLTPVELLVMLGWDGGAAPLNRARLQDLTREFPDTTRSRE